MRRLCTARRTGQPRGMPRTFDARVYSCVQQFSRPAYDVPSARFGANDSRICAVTGSTASSGWM
jgi:hypothetical protein